MLTVAEREAWFTAYLEAALEIGASRKEAVAWALSIATIAEQHDNDNDDREPEMADG